MTLQQAIQDITAKPNWYKGVMSQPQASGYLRDINNGSAGTKRIANFLAKLGYKLEISMEVRK